MTGADSGSEAAGEIPERVDVAVVGAGLAGLAAARALEAGGATTAVLEARDRVGGRTFSVPMGKAIFDRGGQWVGPTQERVLALARRLGAATFPTYSQGRKILDLEGKISTYKRSIPSLPLLQLVELHLGLRRVDALSREVAAANPVDAREARAWDSMSVETFKHRHLRSASVRNVFDVAVRTIFGAEPGELSLLYFLAYMRAGGGILRLAEIKDGAQQDRFVRGAQQLAEGLAAELEGPVALSAPVRRIEQDADGVTVVSERGAVRARYAVVALPPPLTARIDYQPAIEPVRDLLSQRMAMGSTVKVFALYDRPFWREAGLSGEVICTSGSPLTVVFDNTSHDNAQPALVAFVVGRAARRWSQRDPAERRREIVAALSRYFGPRAADPVEVIEQDWSAEPYTRGCPVGVMPPGVLTNVPATLRAPVGRIHWAGTETATVWTGYMEGALESGERAARDIMRQL